MPTLGRKQAVDSAGKSESEICSPQDPIAYLSCRISGCNFQLHDREASWDLIVVAALEIRFRLWYRPMSWFLPPPPASRPPPPGAWPLQLSMSPDRAPRTIHGSIQSSEIGSVLPLESVLGSVQSSRLGVRHRVQLGVSLRACLGVYLRTYSEVYLEVYSVCICVLRAHLGVFSQAGWECVIECNWECSWERAQQCDWERLESLLGSV